MASLAFSPVLRFLDYLGQFASFLACLGLFLVVLVCFWYVFGLLLACFRSPLLALGGFCLFWVVVQFFIGCSFASFQISFWLVIGPFMARFGLFFWRFWHVLGLFLPFWLVLVHLRCLLGSFQVILARCDLCSVCLWFVLDCFVQFWFFWDRFRSPFCLILVVLARFWSPFGLLWLVLACCPVWYRPQIWIILGSLFGLFWVGLAHWLVQYRPIHTIFTIIPSLFIITNICI